MVIENVESEVLDLIYISLELLKVKLVLKTAIFGALKVFGSIVSSVIQIIEAGYV